MSEHLHQDVRRLFDPVLDVPAEQRASMHQSNVNNVNWHRRTYFRNPSSLDRRYSSKNTERNVYERPLRWIRRGPAESDYIYSGALCLDQTGKRVARTADAP